MAEYAVVNKTQLDADMTSVADTIRTKGGTTEQLAWPDGYKAAVEAIQTGGGITPPASKTLDPDVVYATTRPADWLPMPTPGDDEIYILCHVMDGMETVFKSQFRFTGSATAAFGTITGGEFVAKETVALSSGTTIEHTIDSEDYGDLTSDGRKQFVVKVKGAVTEFNGYTRNGPHPGVEIICGIDLDKMQNGYVIADGRDWNSLRYISFVGNGGAKNLNQAFYGSKNLRCVRCEKNNIVNDLSNSFRQCKKLIAVSPNLVAGTNGAISTRYAFEKCGLDTVPNFKIVSSDPQYMFQETSFDSINFSNIDTSGCENMSSIFHYFNTREIRNLDISSLTTTSNFLTSAFYLEYFTFAGDTTPGGITITFANAIALTRRALVDTINSLPTATASATLNISACAGAAELTEEEIAVATAKNWTLTI